MNKRLIKRLVAALLIIVMLVPCAYITSDYVYGDQNSDLQNANDKKNDIESKLEETRKTISDLQQKTSDAQSYIAQLDAKMAEVDGSLDQLATQIEQLEIEIEDTSQKLEAAEADASQQYDAMKMRIQFMYEHNDETYLSLLVNSSSMGEMLNRAEYITKISQYDREMLQKYNATVTYIALAKAQLDKDHEELVAAQASLEDQRAALSLLEETKIAELNSLKSMVSQQESYKASLEADKAAQERLIAQIEEEIRKKEQNGSSNISYDGGKFKWPTPSTRITSDYGDMEDRTSPHIGIDIGALNRGVAGDPIYAAYDGEVVISTYSSSAGNYIMINHGGGLYTRYLHCSSLLVKAGTYVTKGQKIALMGTTGDSNGVHLHFDVRYNGKVVNPWNYLSR
ncbi:MAG: murein hydrolase activator EnvC family protein [Lachnospira sp.]